MTWKDDDLPALRELESTIIRLWSQHEALNDYAAGRAYEAAFQYYRARRRGHEPKPVTASGLDLDSFNAVRETCEKLLTSGAAPLQGTPKGITDPVPLDKLLQYLRELARSVERHTQHGGRCGYLEFVRAYLP